MQEEGPGLMAGEVRPRLHAWQGFETRPLVTAITPYALTGQFFAVQMLLLKIRPCPGWITAQGRQKGQSITATKGDC